MRVIILSTWKTQCKWAKQEIQQLQRSAKEWSGFEHCSNLFIKGILAFGFNYPFNIIFTLCRIIVEIYLSSFITVGKRSTSSTRPSLCWPDAPGTAINRGTLRFSRMYLIAFYMFNTFIMMTIVIIIEPVRDFKVVPLGVLSMLSKLKPVISKKGNLKILWKWQLWWWWWKMALFYNVDMEELITVFEANPRSSSSVRILPICESM